MRHLSRSIKRGSLHRGAAPLLCCLLVLACCSLVQAQSGRRVTKRSPSTPVPSAETGQTTAPPVAKAEKDEIAFYVCAGERDPFMSIPRYVTDTVRNVFVQRISQASSINVTSGPEMHRTEAIKRAKAAQKEFVVLLEVVSDEFDSSRSSLAVDLSKLVIRYYVFTPGTGKSKMEGVVYQQQYRVGRGGVSVPTTRRNGPLYSDYLLKEAAKDAANRVLAAFRTYTPPRDPGLTEK